MTILSKIIESHCLANGFQELTLEHDSFVDAKPGHYIKIKGQAPNKMTLYLMKKSIENQVCCIMPPGSPIFSDKQTFVSSDLKGTPLLAPSPHYFYLLISTLHTLSACIFYLKYYKKQFNGLVLIGAEGALPFHPAPSREILHSLPSNVIASLPLLEDWGIANRLANTLDSPGCFHGTADELAKIWLAQTSQTNIQTLIL